jgi:DNA-binding CsgD family transcriptional regulator
MLSTDLATPLLTDRELTVLRLLASGYSSKEIARELRVSPRTIEAQRTTAKQKFRAKTIPHLIALAVEAGLVGPVFGRIEPAEDGLVKITGRKPSPEILEQLKGRIGPGEAAVEISAEVARDYIRRTGGSGEDQL